MNDIGEQIKKLRLFSGMTQEQFANAIGKKRNSISMIESGRNNPTFEFIADLCSFYNITADYFLTNDNPEFYEGIDQLKVIDNVQVKVANNVQQKKSETKLKASNEDFLKDELNRTRIKKPVITSENESQIIDKSFVYTDNAPFYLESHVQKKLLLELLKGNNERAKLFQNINTLMNFQYIIMNLDHYYFENIDKKEHEVSKYYNGKSFDYEAYRDSILKEIDKYLGFNAPLASLVEAINNFYANAKEADTENIIEGYFNQIKP